MYMPQKHYVKNMAKILLARHKKNIIDEIVDYLFIQWT